MAVTRRARGHKPRVIMAGGLLALAALTQLPAQAANEPNLVAMSTDSGWSNGQVIAAQLDRNVRCVAADGGNVVNTKCEAALSKLTVTKADGTAVPGDTYLSYSAEFLTTDTLLWKPVLPANQRVLDAGDYKIAMHVVPMTSDSRDFADRAFKIDNGLPFAPVIATPGEFDIIPTGDVEITGAVTDRIGTASVNGTQQRANVAGTKSGIANVVIQFYNALDISSYPLNPSILTNGAGEIRNLRRAAALEPCTAAIAHCTAIDGNGQTVVVQDKAYKTTVALPTGLWTIRVVTTDVAGNQSVVVQQFFVKVAP